MTLSPYKPIYQPNAKAYSLNSPHARSQPSHTRSVLARQVRALERPTAGELASWVDGALSDLKELKDDTLLDEGHARVFASRLRDVATWLDPQGVGRPTPDTPSQPTVVIRRPLQALGSPRDAARAACAAAPTAATRHA